MNFRSDRSNSGSCRVIRCGNNWAVGGRWSSWAIRWGWSNRGKGRAWLSRGRSSDMCWIRWSWTVGWSRFHIDWGRRTLLGVIWCWAFSGWGRVKRGTALNLSWRRTIEECERRRRERGARSSFIFGSRNAALWKLDCCWAVGGWYRWVLKYRSQNIKLLEYYMIRRLTAW